MTHETIRHQLAEVGDLLRRAQQLEGADVSVVDGIVMMTPMTPEHSDSILEATVQLRPQLPDGDLALHTDVQFTHPAWPVDRYPDLAVRALGDTTERAPFDAARLLLAIEIVSVSSVENDYFYKADEYCNARVPAYLILDPYIRSWRLHTRPQPENEQWAMVRSARYAETLAIPLPDGPTLTLDTAKLPVAPPEKQRDHWPLRRLRLDLE